MANYSSSRTQQQFKNIRAVNRNYSDNSFDGTAEIINGEIIITPPRGFGKFPMLSAGEHVEIYLNGQKAETPVIVTENDTLEVRTLDTSSSVDLHASLTKDKMKAYLTVKRNPGKKFHLLDCEPLNRIKILAECVHEEEPDPVNATAVMDFLRQNGVIFGVSEEAVQQVAQSREREIRVLVAHGLEPSGIEDASIMYNLKEEKEKNTESVRNPYGEGKIASVATGEIVAIKRPPRPGNPGIDVTGQLVPPREPKDIAILIKDGVKLINDGTVAIATRSGKPVLEGYGQRYLSVRPVYVVEGDVDLNVGNIKFNGDVIVTGSVLDGFRIEAGGSIKVFGDVIHASLYANGDITINMKAITARLQAGGTAIPYKRIYHLLEQLDEKIKNLLLAIEMVKAQPAFSMIDLKEKGEGQLIQLLLDFRFKDIPKLITKLIEIVLKEADKGILPEVVKITQLLSQKLSNLGPLRLQHTNELEILVDELEKTKGMLNHLALDSANITVNYVQNCQVMASGDINITGEGSIISQLEAGGKLNISRGIVRGGRLSAREQIRVMELGSSQDAEVHVRLLDNCMLEADIVRPVVIIEHATRTKMILEYQRHLKLYVENGHLVEN